MTAKEVIIELESLATDLMKKRYKGRGAQEPFFGVATGVMKPLHKKIGINHALAEELYASGNYDVMYFAGMIADPNIMAKDDFNRWMQTAYFPMLSDFVVAVTLSESPLAMEIANEWLDNDKELYRSAGWSAYQWLLGWQKDDFFQKDKVAELLKRAVSEIGNENKNGHMHGVINDFIAAVGVSYIPLHNEAAKAAKQLAIRADKTIFNAAHKGKVGFKRRAVRC